jgi:hypothetical protein
METQIGFSNRYRSANPQPIGLKCNMKLSFEPKIANFYFARLPAAHLLKHF